MAATAKRPTKLLPVITVDSPANLLLPGNVRQFQVDHPVNVAALVGRAKGRELVLAYQDSKDKLKYGCQVTVIQAYELPEGGKFMVIFAGESRCTLAAPAVEKPGGRLLAQCTDLLDTSRPGVNETAAFRRTIEKQLGKLLRNNVSEITSEAVRTAANIDEIGPFVDFLVLATAGRDNELLLPGFLCEASVTKRAKLLVGHLVRLNERHAIDRKIRRRVKQQMEKTHHEFHLSEQAKAIQEELDRGGVSTLDDLGTSIKQAGMPEAAQDKIMAEYHKLQKCQPMSPESSVLRSYIETVIDLPWQQRSELQDNMRKALQVLDEDHYGLKKVKDRIMEYLAVQRRTSKPQGTVMCFVGPPGVGKTSLGKSIARATGREFVRVSLGGVHEEAAIRGHRKTYVASMPGRILKAMAKAKVRNPVFMLDEFDKIVSGANFHGDPAAALLEVLDPEQNSTFTDQYVEVEFDLSEVMFITTANSVRKLPDALYDRLEIIRLPGYTDREKLAIANRHLIPKQLSEHRLKPSEVRFGDAITTEIIHDYTHEAGVRNLERNIAKICRKIVTERLLPAAGKPSRKVAVTRQRVHELLEVPEYYSTFVMPNRSRVGYANAMIYGYGVFRMEAIVHKTKADGVSITGITEGEKELTALANVATSLLSSRHAALGLAQDFTRNRRLHIHLQDQATTPFGALGLGLFVLLASTYTGCAISPSIALLGEINLRGDVISSEYYTEYKATVIDAQRKKIKRIIMPYDDARLLEELPEELAASIEFVLVRNVWEALREALASQPKRLTSNRKKQLLPTADKQSEQQQITQH